MRDKIIGPLLDELPNEKREVIEEFFETVNQRMLENADVEKNNTAQQAATETSKIHVNVGGHTIDLKSDDFKFLTPTSKLSEISNLVDMDYGAPAPIVLAGEHRLSIGYYLSNHNNWDGKTSQPRRPSVDEALMVVFYIDGLSSFSQRGTLQPDHQCAYFTSDDDSYPSHGVWEVKTGPAVAFQNSLLAYENDKHLIFSFHDTSIECFCNSYRFEVRTSVSKDLVPQMSEFVYL